MSAPLPDDPDDQYASSEDSDFAPDAAPADDSGASDSDSDGEAAAAPKTKQPKSKQKAAAAGGNADDEDAGYDNSGDEAIIKRGEKRRARKNKGGADHGADDDEGGEGGLIKTRRQRAAEKEERRAAVVSGPVTIDVDAVWAQMLAGKTTTTETPATATADEPEAQAAPEPAPAAAPTADLVRIRRTYNFAGKTHTEEKMVPRDSAEARLYFESEEGRKSANAAGGADSLPEGRVTKRAFRSAFEPVFAIVDPTAAAGAGARRTDLNLSVAARLQAGREGQAARKLNTVEKSRMDWAGFVDREGIKDELDMAGRAKDSYAARQDFLARSEARREEEAYKARVGAR